MVIRNRYDVLNAKSFFNVLVWIAADVQYPGSLRNTGKPSDSGCYSQKEQFPMYKLFSRHCIVVQILSHKDIPFQYCMLDKIMTQIIIWEISIIFQIKLNFEANRSTGF